MSWNKERVDALKVAWAAGMSATEIAGHIGHVTRNAVIGKVHRLGLSGRATGARQKLKLKAGADYHKAKAPKPERKLNQKAIIGKLRSDPSPMVEAPPKIARVGDLEPHHCRWIAGEPGTGFCGDHKVLGLPYCKRHAMRAFSPVQPKKEPVSASAAALGYVPQPRVAEFADA